jgi:spore photoproduct lyase
MPHFDHIYIEKKAFSYPLTNKILNSLSSSNIIEISDYREFFCRPNQDFSIQKLSRKLILAVKKKNYLYPLPEICGRDRNRRSFYITQVINCIYDCSYCFLQGMNPSANITAFVNLDDFLEEAKKEASSSPVKLYLSHETDLPALDSILAIASRWIEFAENCHGLTLEIRTKSALSNFLKGFKNSPNVIPAWSLLPQEVISMYERLTPGLSERLRAIRKAADAGWKIRLCFDPIMIIDNWQKIYKNFIGMVMTRIPRESILDIQTGVFRMGETYFKRLKRVNPHPAVVHYPFYRIKGGIVTYDGEISASLNKLVKDEIMRVSGFPYQGIKTIFPDAPGDITSL